jgi:hypothetical protein
MDMIMEHLPLRSRFVKHKNSFSKRIHNRLRMRPSHLAPMPSVAMRSTADPMTLQTRCAPLSRRVAATLLTYCMTGLPPAALANTISDPSQRPRDMMQYAPLLSNDYYYIFGKLPPRKISGSKIDQPQWNTFGACLDNSCTYVPIAQRYSAFSKYEPRISRGLRAYSALLPLIEQGDWPAVAASVANGKQDMSPAVDALLPSGLLASALLVSPNNLKEKKEASLATFYVNEANFALSLIRDAAAKRDYESAKVAWEFGRDSWNSFLAVVNPSIVPKVGEPFEPVMPFGN